MSALIGLALWLVSETIGAEPKRPNLLLVTIDTLRWDHTSLHGYANPTTPGLERLAEESAVFETAYAPSSTTAPSHATLLTGLYPPTHGVLKNAVPLPRRHRTLAERLAAEGYQTGAVVSSFVLDAKFQWNRGFDTYLDDFQEESASVSQTDWEGHAVGGGFDRRALATTHLASRWIWERDRHKPFFLFVHYFDPHSPYAPPSDWDRRFPVPPAEGRSERDARLVREQRALYDSEIAYTDRALGQLIEVLRVEGLASETLVVITADHGEGLMDHGFMGHGTSLYEELVRVPLLLRWPGVISSRRFEAPVELVDLAPTVLALLGVPSTSSDFQGRSLVEVLQGRAEIESERPVYLTRRPYEGDRIEGRWLDGELFAIRVGPWKYIGGAEDVPGELYHLVDDPSERRNLREPHADVAARLAGELDRWRKAASGATGPLPALSDEDRRALEALGYVE